MSSTYQQKNKHVPDTRGEIPVNLRLRDYLEYIEIARNLSPLTVSHVKHVVGKFTKHFDGRTASSVDFYELENWMVEQSSLPSAKGVPKSPSTINLERATIRAFLRYCQNSGDPLKFDPSSITNMKIKQHRRSVICPEEILAVARDLPYERLRLAVLVTFFAGLRIGEVVKLRPRHLNGRVLAIEDSKSEEPRPAFLPQELADELRQYIKNNKITDGRIFPYGTQIQSAHYERYQTNGLRNQIQRHFAKAGYKITPHDLRHSFATMLHSNGADIFTIKEFLGHSDVRTTQLYIHMDRNDLQLKHDQFANISY